MAKKEIKDKKIKEIKAPIPPVSPLFSNVSMISPHTDMVMLDFGFIGPSYFEPYDFEDNHISRICLDWKAAESLLEQLSDAISEYKKKFPSKRKAKIKKGAK